MKILLVGEYSRLHNSLKEGLIALGHEVTLVSSGDGLKQYDSDYLLTSKIKKNKVLNFLNNLSIRLLNKNFIQTEYAKQFKKLLSRLKGYDTIQLINEDAIGATPKASIKLFNQLFSQNNNVFLLCCGEDYTTINYYLNQTKGYSVLTPYLEDKALKNIFHYSLKYVTKPYKKLHEFIKSKSKGTIASDIDYHIPMFNEANYLGLIANPINTDLIEYTPIKITKKINIFLGINTLSQIKKGSSYFEAALKIIQQKHPDIVTVKVTRNLPYKEYIKIYDNAHIVLDQVYGYDQGYNALEAMAKGKVVFTGAEKEWLEFYNLKEDSIAINALPDVNYLVEKLEWLINNPKQIETISKNANAFIKKHHDYKLVAEQYLKTWTD